MKFCQKCKLEKEERLFSKNKSSKDGLRHYCKLCDKEWRTTHRNILIEKKKKYYIENKKKWQEYSTKNKDSISEWQKTYYSQNKEWYAERNKRYYHKNRIQCLKMNYTAKKIRLASSPKYRLLENYRKRVWDALKFCGKSQRTEELLGCTVSELKRHLESKFRGSMSWSNYGKWHVDHIIPCSNFDFLDVEQQKQCFHYTNLQPLWARENLEKSDKWVQV